MCWLETAAATSCPVPGVRLWFVGTMGRSLGRGQSSENGRDGTRRGGAAEIIPGITLRIATLHTGYTTQIMGFPVYTEPLLTHAVTAWVMSEL